MPFKSKEFIDNVILAIIQFQTDELLSDRELSKLAWLSPTMVSKIKNWKTIPKLSTIRKLRDIWVNVWKPWHTNSDAPAQNLPPVPTESTPPTWWTE